MTEIKVSVVIPNYNHRKFLKRRIDTVLEQSFQSFEVIILDDKSLDNSEEIIEAYRNHPKISHIIYNEQNSGSPFKQWQHGISLAKGEWIWVAESDDYNAPTFLEKALKSLEKHHLATLFFCQSNEVDAEDNLIDDMNWLTSTISTYNWEDEFCVDGEDFSQNALLQKNPIVNASGVIFRNSTQLSKRLKKITKYKMCGDWLFWSFVMKDNKVVFSPEKLNFFRSHCDSTRSNLTLIRRIRRAVEEASVQKEIKHLYQFPSNKDYHFLKQRSFNFKLIRQLSKILNLVPLLNIVEAALKLTTRLRKLPV